MIIEQLMDENAKGVTTPGTDHSNDAEAKRYRGVAGLFESEGGFNPRGE